MSVTRTRPRANQVLFRSPFTGDTVLDVYLSEAQIAGKDLGELLGQIFSGADGKPIILKWRGDWQASTQYYINDVVKVGFNWFIATAEHVSGGSIGMHFTSIVDYTAIATHVTTNANAADASAISASASATNSSNSADAALVSQNAAASSASAASGSASAANTSAINASNSEIAAADSVTTASGHATTATTQAGVATTQAGIATTKASEASASADTASTQAGIATTGANTATTQAGIATTKADEASASADAAAVSAASITPGHTTGNVVPAGGANGALTVGTNDATALTLKTNNVGRVTVDSAGNVGIGTSNPAVKLHVTGGASPLILSRSDGNIDTFVTASDTGGAGLVGNGSNHPLALLTNNVERLRIDASGNVGIGTSSPGSLLTVSGGSVELTQAADTGFVGLMTRDSTGVNGVAFRCNANGSATIRANAIDSLNILNGNVLVTSSGGLGYGVGSGGSVTQETSITTGVTLNKPTGRIIMTTGSIAANSAIAFFLNNSYITQDDLVICHSSFDGVQAAVTLLTVSCLYSQNGAAIIRIVNFSGSNQTISGLRVRFAVIKGVLS